MKIVVPISLTTRLLKNVRKDFDEPGIQEMLHLKAQN